MDELEGLANELEEISQKLETLGLDKAATAIYRVADYCDRVVIENRGTRVG